jgi:DNA-binding CsgD family transcriptional regulator
MAGNSNRFVRTERILNTGPLTPALSRRERELLRRGVDGLYAV